MMHHTQVVSTFPSVQIANENGGLPVEVSLIAQLGHGAGNHMFSQVASKQRGHHEFIDELDEPSAKLGGINLDLKDYTSLYSFVVGPKGHPFHRHAGHRIFTAVSGSGGAQLRFSSASMNDIKKEPRNFIKALQFVNIPPDCLFTVRFGGEVWHQFYPLSKNSLHPVFFALSCHTNELGGDLTKDLRDKIKAGDADIPSLTEVLPDDVMAILNSKDFQNEVVPTTTLAVDAAAGTFHRAVCDTVRSNMGVLRGVIGAWNNSGGFVSKTGQNYAVKQLDKLPYFSLLNKYFQNEKIHHEDTFVLEIQNSDFAKVPAARLLEAVLDGFLMNAPKGVTRLMLLRNLMVKPLGLRTSPLGCPVSSLLSENKKNLFALKFPVFEQEISKNGDLAQVILGADDKHLKFRSCVAVKCDENVVNITLGTRVQCKNMFGLFYMGAIDNVHRKYVSPAMLRQAADYAIQYY